jgi:zinc finger protein
MPEDELAVICPVCEKGRLNITSMLYSVPFFNQLAMFNMECSSCSFVHNDIFSTEQRKPSRWTLSVDDPLLLRVRVVRSSSGTLRFPEFGIDIEPGPAAESFVTNVEGVLLRLIPVVESAIRFAEKESEKQRGAEILEMIENAREGEFTFSIVIEDPAGISGILPDDLSLVKIEELSQDEASHLKGAPIWLDAMRDELQERKG